MLPCVLQLIQLTMSKANGFVCVPVRTGLVAIGGQVKHTCLLIEIWVSLWLAVTECGELELRGTKGEIGTWDTSSLQTI